MCTMGSGEEIRSSAKRSAYINASATEITRLGYGHLQKGDSLKAAECFESAAEKAGEEGDEVVMISCYLNAGACLVSNEQLLQANKYLISALKLAKAQKPDENVSRSGMDGTETKVSITEISGDIHFNLGIAAEKMQKFKSAVAFFKASADLYLKAGSVLHAAETYSNLASCHRKAKERHSEVACLITARQLYQELGDTYHEAETCLELARTYQRESLVTDCKEMLSTAKLLCLRVKERLLQGKLLTQFGLIYTSMGAYDVGIQNFELALPLVREDKETEESLQVEASLLQNIGAAYNEKALFLEAMVYHREAAAIHGKVHNHNSESKTLCNMAYAQTQLNQLQEAAKTFSTALAKAYQAKNSFLQFQTCEGLGSVHHQLGRFDEAVRYFRQALSILDQIREDTGIARERVMEKLSETSEALQAVRGEGASQHSTGEEEVEEREKRRSKMHSILTPGVGYGGGHMPALEGEERAGGSEDSTDSELERGHVVPFTKSEPNRLNLSLGERRGKPLPPIKTKGSDPGIYGRSALEPLDPPSWKGKQKLQPLEVGREPHQASPTPSNYSAVLQEYMESYMDSPSPSNTTSQWSRDMQRQLSATPGPSTSQAGSDQRTVREGSLAIGENARDAFTVQTIQEWSKGKKGKKKRKTRSEIIQTTHPPPATSSDSVQEDRVQRSQLNTTKTTEKQSKICTIL